MVSGERHCRPVGSLQWLHDGAARKRGARASRHESLQELGQELTAVDNSHGAGL